MIGNSSNKAHSRVRPLCVLSVMLLIQAAAVCVFAKKKVKPEYVDLGLSVMWATCNMGAATPWEVGYSYHFESYEGRWSIFHGKASIPADSDAANLLWGDEWRIPSKDEIIELLSYCTLTWVDNADSCGFKVTSKIEGFTDCSIFLPVYKTRTAVYEIINTNDGGHRLNVVDSTYNYTGNYMTNYINELNKAVYLKLWDVYFKMNKSGVWPQYESFFIRPVKPLDPVTKQNRVLPQVELRETNIKYGEPGDIDISDFEELGITKVDEGLQW